MRYKTNHGAIPRIEVSAQGQMMQVNAPTGRYGSDEVFSLQFPHYKKLLGLVNEREADE